MNKTFYKLVNLADHLDNLNLTKEADNIDRIIKTAVEMTEKLKAFAFPMMEAADRLAAIKQSFGHYITSLYLAVLPHKQNNTHVERYIDGTKEVSNLFRKKITDVTLTSAGLARLGGLWLKPEQFIEKPSKTTSKIEKSYPSESFTKRVRTSPEFLSSPESKNHRKTKTAQVHTVESEAPLAIMEKIMNFFKNHIETPLKLLVLPRFPIDRTFAGTILSYTEAYQKFNALEKDLSLLRDLSKSHLKLIESIVKSLESERISYYEEYREKTVDKKPVHTFETAEDIP